MASEELGPGHSWPYETIFGALRADSGCIPAEISTSIVDHYTSYGATYPAKSGDVTQVALDLSQMNHLAQNVTDLTVALSEDMDTNASNSGAFNGGHQSRNLAVLSGSPKNPTTIYWKRKQSYKLRLQAEKS